MAALPIIDLSPIRKGTNNAHVAEAAEALRDACRNPGFCYLVGHGIDPALDRRALAAANDFFELPEADKRAIAIGGSPHFRGYTVLGDERTQGRRDWREQIDIGPEQSPAELTPGDPAWMRLLGPNQWPTQVPALQPAISDWLHAMTPIALTVLRTLAQSLSQEPAYFDASMDGTPYTRVKVIRYPAANAKAGDQGLGLHHDSGLLSFVLQDGVTGLQVESEDTLIDVTPIPGTYVMNLGEMLQAASNGYLRATRHRVVSPQHAPRTSIAYFVNPRLDARFTPMALPPELAAIADGGQNADPDDPVHEVFGDNTLKIRMRAHPDVTQRFYGDLAPSVGPNGAADDRR